MQRLSNGIESLRRRVASAHVGQPMRLARMAVLSAMALSVNRCTCASDQGPANLLACSHVTNAKKDLDTFIRNHPVGGAPDPTSQVAVLDHMIDELTAAKNQGPDQSIKDELDLAINDATQMQADIAAGTPVTSASLISDFDNLASLCGGASGSNITTP